GELGLLLDIAGLDLAVRIDRNLCGVEHAVGGGRPFDRRILAGQVRLHDFSHDFTPFLGLGSGIEWCDWKGYSVRSSIFFRKVRVRSWDGFLNTSLGDPCSTIRPSSMKIARSETSPANWISWVTIIMVRPSSASLRMTPSTSPTSSGSSAEVGSSNR